MQSKCHSLVHSEGQKEGQTEEWQQALTHGMVGVCGAGGLSSEIPRARPCAATGMFFLPSTLFRWGLSDTGAQRVCGLRGRVDCKVLQARRIW